MVNWSWAYDGVNGSIPRNTGKDCVEYLSTARHVLESIILIPLAVTVFRYGLTLCPPIKIIYSKHNQIVIGKQLLLITMTALLGLEMGFKLCTRTAIFIFNPCHVISMLQVYLLAAKPSQLTTILFRIHLNFLNGPTLAFLFPEHDSRRITFELPTYYLQHGMMFVIAIYLLRHGGAYQTENFYDFSYNLMAYGIFIFYHFTILEFLAVTAHVNLNHMICPAILDPFQGGNYRLIACLHQAFLCPFVSKFLIYMFGRADDDNINSDECYGKAIDNIDNNQKRLMNFSSIRTNHNVIVNSDCNVENQLNTGCDNDKCASNVNSNANEFSPKKTI